VRGHEVEDSACITLTFKSGALGSIVASDAAPSPWSYETTTFENPDYHHVHENCCFFFGSRRSLVFPTMEMWSYENDEAAGWQHPLRRETLVVERNDPLIAQLRNFCQVIRREVKPLVSGEDGLATLAATLAILESAETNAPVKL
jgi:predicted dehydrogenase